MRAASGMRAAPGMRAASGIRASHELDEEGDAFAPEERRVEVIGHAERGVVHEDLDVLSELLLTRSGLGPPGPPQRGVEIGKALAEPAQEIAHGVAGADRLREELAPPADT